MIPAASDPHERNRRARAAGLAKPGGPLSAAVRAAVTPVTLVPGVVFNRAARRASR